MAFSGGGYLRLGLDAFNPKLVLESAVVLITKEVRRCLHSGPGKKAVDTVIEQLKTSSGHYPPSLISLVWGEGLGFIDCRPTVAVPYPRGRRVYRPPHRRVTSKPGGTHGPYSSSNSLVEAHRSA